MESELRFILLGKTGVGKSATGNVLLKKKAFKSSQSFSSVTKVNSSVSVRLDLAQREITVVDTPGLFDNKRPMLETIMEIQKSLYLAKPGPNAFLLVIKPGRFTDEEEQTVALLKMTFGNQLLNYTIVIFTHEDQIDGDIKNIIDENSSVKAVLDECGGRYITLNNLEDNNAVMDGKLEELMRLANEVSDNGKKIYAKNINIYRNVLQSHVQEWTLTRLTGEQIKLILHEQEEERSRQMLRTGVKIVGVALASVSLVGVGAGAAVAVATGAAGAACVASAVGVVTPVAGIAGKILTRFL